jgi:hypothetical protein
MSLEIIFKIFLSWPWPVILSILGLILSIINFWYNFLRKAKPSFVCSSWSAIGMQHKDGYPRIAFAIKISVTNNGVKPLIIKDFYLLTKDETGSIFHYEPIVLFDLRQWIEDGNRPDKVGRAQKGQIPLPFVVPPKKTFSFEHHLYFLPTDKTTMVDPRISGSIKLRLFAITDRFSSYKLIGEQKFLHDDIKNLTMGNFSSVLSDVSTKKRSEFIKRFKWN